MNKEHSTTPGLGQVIQIDESKVQEHLGAIVRGTVEETLNSMLDAEANQLCKARRYERTAARKDYRAGTYTRTLHTKAGVVSLKVPKLRTVPFETAIIKRYRRRESFGGRGVGLNSKIITIKRRACGFRDKHHFKTAISFYCAGLDQYVC